MVENLSKKEALEYVEKILKTKDQNVRLVTNIMAIYLSEYGFLVDVEKEKLIKNWLTKYSFSVVCGAIITAFKNYPERLFNDELDSWTKEKNVEVMWKVITGILRNKNRQPEDDKLDKEINTVRATLRGRLSYINEQKAKKIIKIARRRGVAHNQLMILAEKVRHWTQFKELLARHLELNPDEI